jgi:hypothetical protein
MFYYSGTDIPIQVNDMVTWYCDDEARGHIVVLEYSYFSVYWNDIKLKLYQIKSPITTIS